MNASELTRIARAMVAPGKGFLAADESTGSIKKRFEAIKLESTEEHRRAYREMLFTAAGAAESVSAVIMFDETIRQKTKDGTPFPKYLADHGMIPGIKVDTGAKPLAGFPGETVTEGLDGLRRATYDLLGVLRVYTKVPGKPADRAKPVTVPIGSNVLDLAREIHRDFQDSLKFARIWGTGVFEGQTVKRDHELHDGDVVELHV